MRRKLFSYVLIAALLAPFTLPFVPVREAEASEMMFRYNEATDTFDGSSNDVKASPDKISYRTVGWTVTKVPTNGNPLAYTHGVMLDNDGNPGFQIREDPPNAGPGEDVRTFFAVPRTVLEQALKDADLLDAVDGQTVYIHSIFRIENSPKNAGKLFYTLDQILAAENWSQATRENLRMRFDNLITFQSPKYDGDAVVRLVRADSTVEERPPENVVKGVKAGTPFSYTLSDTISRDGKTYQLYKSYIRYKLKPEVEHFPQFEGDPSLKTRNPTVAVGGTDIVGVYREQQTQRPDLVAVDITANGPIEVGKPTNFTAKWRVDNKTTGKPYNVKIMVDGGELKLASQPASEPGEYSINFTYTFTSAEQKTFLLVVDSANAIAESNENNNQVSKSFKGVDPNKNFTGDFDVLPPIIEFREPFELKPKNFVFRGCTYDSHRYKIERNGDTYYTSWANSQSESHSYSYSTYPRVIGIGTHIITLEIRTKDCGTAQPATHTLVVNGPSGNNPPQFEIGFVYPFNPTQPVHEVVEGTVMHLIYINDPSVPTPYDPDGDPLEFLGFDFSESSSWAKTIPQNYPEYGDGYHNIVMNGIGYHQVKATMRDAFGATTTRTTYIRVIPPNPVAVIEGPKEVKEGRPLPQPFSSAKSYSPVGRSIDHSKDEWTNLKDVYTKPGKETITLYVTDSIGLRSLEPAVHELIVLPDEPPVAKLEVEPRGIRGQTYYVYNKSYSPDGDKIASVQYKMRYDDENNGFDDDPWTDMTGDMTRAVFKPNRVGKYQFYVKVCEDYGKCDDTLSDPVEVTMMDVRNLPPEVSFELEGKNPQPDLSLRRVYTPAEMFNWTLTGVNSTSALDGKRMRWSFSDTELFGKTGKKNERLYGNGLYYPTGIIAFFPPFADAGYGKNGYNLYRPIGAADPNKTLSQPLLVPNPSTGEWTPIAFGISSNKPNFVSTPTHVYFSHNGRFFALNKSKIGRYEYNFEVKNGSIVGLRHDLPDGSYYDYILNAPSIKYYAEVRDWKDVPEFVKENERKPGVSYAPVTLTPDKYFVTEDTVYQIAKWSCSCLKSDGEIYTKNGQTIISYDLKTGEMIANGLEKRIDYFYNTLNNGFSRNGNLVIWYSDFKKLSAHTYDRHLNLKSTKEIPPIQINPPQPYLTCSGAYNYELAFEDLNENTYMYEEHNCMNGSMESRNYGSVYLVKFDPDFNLVWRTKLEGTDFKPNISDTAVDIPDMVVNSAQKEIIVRTYKYTNEWNGTKVLQAVNMDTGAVRTLDPNLVFDFEGTNFDIDAFGQKQMRSTKTTPYSYTPYGIKFTWNQNRYNGYTWDGQSQFSFTAGGIIDYDGYMATAAERIMNSQYVGDGILLSMMISTASPYSFYFYPWLNVGVPVGGERQGPGLTLGQLLSPDNVKDHEITFTLSLDDADVDRELVGMSFRAANAANRYAVETNGSTIYLSKYVNGNRTVLAQQNYPFQDGVKVLFKVKFAGDKLELFVNGVPYFNVTDGTFTSGKFGPFSDKSYVRFGPVSVKEVVPDEIIWDAEYAIWEEGSARAEIQYKNIKFNDPEGDPPAGSYQWTYVHTPMFMLNQGLSALHNKTFSEGQIYFDKVGLYEVRLSAKDDPHPDYRYPSKVFDEYREPSNVFGKRIIVHRRPVARFTLSLNSDKTVRFNDTSYDPDRWASASEFSPPEDGKNYQTTRGIFERKYYYITPSGAVHMEKLVVPREAGTYTVGMAVKDEYGAWSDYYEQVITVHELPAPNEPPHAGFTVNPATTYRGVAVTIDSTAWDKEDGDRTKLPHEYYISNVNGGSESLASASRTSWTKTFNTVGTFRIRQVVWDSLGQTDQAIQTVTILNRKPQANVTTPASADPANPTKFDVLRPTFVWTYSDADGDAQTQYQVQIYRTNGSLERDTGARSGTAKNWVPTADLPERVTMYIRVRVHDGYDWSDWSGPKYFYIETNRPPVADFDWSPKPAYEGDTITLIDRSTDPDGDPLTYQWSVSGPNGYTRSGSTQAFAIPGADTENRTGVYNVTLTVRDPKGASDSVTKPITVLPLIIEGEVHHTPEWREKHAAAGHEVEHDPKDFYSGEIMRVAAVISAAPANEVTAELRAVSKTGDSIRKRVVLTNAGGLRYEGELHDESWMSFDGEIREGEHTIVFQVVYRNGVKKETSVPVRIIGNIYKAVSVHRVQ
ncbi:Putative PKD domain containing protein [Thermobacillus xylanilyticus]|uniref:PKD domain containing protein n=1 Tax=Thermobacillus xylanilyticus TaxID=76633 RepID=A0ABM8V7L9_THEXY|nr:CARDB domain-containing protein [Thermobacillus xylanilyticus]CAG5091502.1 Putative PKD domain containing protein [Thermobacillus xylanilyticus]